MKIPNLRRFALIGAIASALILGGCGDSDNGFVFTPNQTQVIQPVQPDPDPNPNPDPVSPPNPPVANDDTFVALGNGTLNQSAANGVLANDQVNGATVEPFQGTTESGATLSLASDGSFTYTPPTGFLGTDRFNYTLTNESGTSEGGVVVVVSDRGFFVDTTAGTNGDGSQANPFNNLADAFNATIFGDTVFVFSGSTISNVTIPQGVNLIGQGTGLIVAQTVAEQGVAPTLIGPVTPSSSNVIAGFRIAGSGSRGIQIDGATQSSNLTIRDNEFQNNTTEHVYIQSPFGPIFIENNTFEDPAANQDAILMEYVSGNRSVTLTIDNNTFSSDGTASLGRAINLETQRSETDQFRIRGNMITGVDNNSSYSDGIYLLTTGASTSSFDIRDNTVTRVENNGIHFDGFEAFSGGSAAVSGDIFNNTITESGANSLFFDYGGGTARLRTFNVFGNTLSSAEEDGINISLDGGAELRFVISGNTISDNADDGILIDRETGASGTYIIQANTFSNNGGDGIEGTNDNSSSAPSLIGLFSNVFTGSAEDDVEFTAVNGAADLCFDIEQNSFSSNVSFNPEVGNTFTVEQFTAGLNTINTFLSGATVTTSGAAIVNAADGDCGIE